MKKTCAVLILFGLIAFPFPAAGQEPDEVSLTLEDAIVKALRNNLNVAVEILGPEVASAGLSRAREMFLPRLDIDYGANRSEEPSTWWLQAADTNISKTMDYTASVSQMIPTGGNVSLSVLSYKSDSNQAFSIINPYYRSQLSFSFTQPLLRDFGPKISRREILVAENNVGISGSQLQSVLIETVYQVQEAYWNLVFAIESLKVKQQSLELGLDLLVKTKKEVEVGQTAPIEVLNAEATVAQREAEILQAEALVKRSEDVLKSIVNVTSNGDIRTWKIVPLDEPSFEPRQISLDEALGMAMEKRPDLEVSRSTISTRKINFKVAKNQLLPSLDLSFTYRSPGISGDRILYLNDDPFTGVIVGTEEGSRSEAFSDAMKFLYRNWSVGLTFSLPLGNLVSKADYALAKLELEQAEARLKNQEQQIYLEVSDAVRNVETDAKRVEATRIARELTEKQLEAEMKKLSVGLTTNYFVLTYQEQLSNARSAELRALVDYILSVARLEKVTGQNLDSRNISIAGRRE